MRKTSLGRRRFLKSAARDAAGAGKWQGGAPPPAPVRCGPGAARSARETIRPATVEVLTTDRPGGDFMVDVIKTLDFEYVAANPGSSFRGLHESLINYGGNQAPEFITCCHEESSVAMAHGYFKAEGKPMAVLVPRHGRPAARGDGDLQRVLRPRARLHHRRQLHRRDAARRPGVEWAHSVQDAAAMVRDFIKWDDLPVSLPHFAESAVRAYKIAMTPPMMPVLIVADGGLQEDPISPEVATAAHSEAHAGVAAAGRFRRRRRSGPAARQRAEPGDRRRPRRAHAGRHGAPHRAGRDAAGAGHRSGRPHEFSVAPSAQSERSRAAAGRQRRRHPRPRADGFLGHGRRVSRSAPPHVAADHQGRARSSSASRPAICSSKGNYQDFQRYPEVDLAMAADAEATLPSLIEAVQAADHRRSQARVRGARPQAGRRPAEGARRARTEATYAWDASPISTARLSAELWAQIKERGLGARLADGDVSRWPMRLWNFDKPYQFLGASGGAGVGYGAPAAVGAALANKKHGRLSVSIQADGDLMYAPGVLWTAAHHQIPLLVGDAQQPRVPPGSHAPAAHGEPAQARRHARRTSARRSRIRTSTSPRSRAAWACTRRDR